MRNRYGYILIILTVALSLPAQAGWMDSFTGALTTFKEKVKEKIAYYFGEKKAEVTPPPQAASTTEPIPQVVKVEKIPTESDIKAIKPKIESIKVARVVTEAKPFDNTQLKLNKSKVPVFDFTQMFSLMKKSQKSRSAPSVYAVPALGIGREPSFDISAFAPVQLEKLHEVKGENVENLDSPKLLSESQFKDFIGAPIVPVLPPEKIELALLTEDKKVTPEKVNKITYTVVDDKTIQLLTVKPFNEEDLKLVRALIMVSDKDRCHVASGIFSELLKSERNDVKLKAHTHLATCLRVMNLPHEAMIHIKAAVQSEDENYAKPALEALLEGGVPVYQENAAADLLLDLKNTSWISEKHRGEADYLKAKYFVRKNEGEKAVRAAEQVKENHPRYLYAQYLAAVGEYISGKVNESIERQKMIATKFGDKRGANENVIALVNLNLGRMAFQRAKYSESLQGFQKVPKGHPLWMQALTEQAWAQLQSKDAAGAIGNMHSIQSPYFEKVYKPESYIIRAIGYLNICQYGDADKTLAFLESKYSPWLEAGEKFLKVKNSDQIYATVIKHISSPPTQDIEGVPHQFLREGARQRDFLNTQESINLLIDEGNAYSFLDGLIQADKRKLEKRKTVIQEEVKGLKVKIATAGKTPGAMENLNAWKQKLSNNEDFLASYQFRADTMEEGRQGLQKLRSQAVARLESSKDKFKQKAGEQLQKHFKSFVKSMKKNFENNELLKYEIYAGAGENIRYKIAGGKTGGPSKGDARRAPAGQNWEFEGEFWEDEIGHYRSQLKNNCQNINQGR